MNGLITSSVIGTGYNLNKDGKNSGKRIIAIICLEIKIINLCIIQTIMIM